jgi:hypothetical protein
LTEEIRNTRETSGTTDWKVMTYKEYGARMDRQKWDTPRTTDTATNLLKQDLETYLGTF